MKKFSEKFAIIYNSYCAAMSAIGKKPSYLSFGQFLGHAHEGRVRAWKNGQWPNTEDVGKIHKKLGFSLRWLVLEEGEPFEENNPINLSETTPEAGAGALLARVEALEVEIALRNRDLSVAGQERAELERELDKLVRERDDLMRELLVLQREHLVLLKGQAGGKKDAGNRERDGSGPALGASLFGSAGGTFHEEKAAYTPRGKPRKKSG